MVFERKVKSLGCSLHSYLYFNRGEVRMEPNVTNCYHTAEELICLLTSSTPPAAPQGPVKHGCWVFTRQNHRCSVEIALEVHQHLMTAQIIKTDPVKSGILPPIDT